MKTQALSADMAPPKNPRYSPKTMSDADFWNNPPQSPDNFEEDADLLDDPQFADPEQTRDHVHIHIHKG